MADVVDHVASPRLDEHFGVLAEMMVPIAAGLVVLVFAWCSRRSADDRKQLHYFSHDGCKLYPARLGYMRPSGTKFFSGAAAINGQVVGCARVQPRPLMNSPRIVPLSRLNVIESETNRSGDGIDGRSANATDGSVRGKDEKHVAKGRSADGSKRRGGRRNKRREPGRGGARRNGGGIGPSSMRSETARSWRLMQVSVAIEDDPGKDVVTATPALLNAVQTVLKRHVVRGSGGSALVADLKVVRKSLDARSRRGGRQNGVSFSYIVDVELVEPATLTVVPGTIESLALTAESGESDSRDLDAAAVAPVLAMAGGTYEDGSPGDEASRVVVVGAGPAGLFAAMQLADAGLAVTIIERGEPVSVRGRHIGALMHRRELRPDSNLCYGEGGAGTWSDGKLTTRIGRNSEQVRSVLQSLVDHGAPSRILVDSKPHLGTDRMVHILRSVRDDLRARGVTFHFGTRVDSIQLDESGACVTGVHVSPTDATGAGRGSRGDEEAASVPEPCVISTSRVVLAVGHSARNLYSNLANAGAPLEPKGFAVGFRVEHPQSLIDELQYRANASLTSDPRGRRGYGKLPVADYRLAASVMIGGGGGWADDAANTFEHDAATNYGRSSEERHVYSFCMCPGGQIVPTATNDAELCVNGMSFSKRSSRWANSALVVGIGPDDAVLDPYREEHGPLAGVAFQRHCERRAAEMGGGNLVAPVQRVVDFLAARDLPDGAQLPPSSYRLGVRAARLDLLYPPEVTRAMSEALREFEQRMPGFAGEDALLHGVETRTSAPVTIPRHTGSLQCLGVRGLFPAGEGAGHAGGIVSAAVDGTRVGKAVAADVAGIVVDDDAENLVATSLANVRY